MTQKLPAMVVASLLLSGVILYTAQTGNRATPAAQEAVSREKILKFIREKFGVLDSVKLSADAFRASDLDRKSTRLNSSHGYISYAVFCLKKKKKSSKTTNYRVNRVY